MTFKNLFRWLTLAAFVFAFMMLAPLATSAGAARADSSPPAASSYGCTGSQGYFSCPSRSSASSFCIDYMVWFDSYDGELNPHCLPRRYTYSQWYYFGYGTHPDSGITYAHATFEFYTASLQSPDPSLYGCSGSVSNYLCPDKVSALNACNGYVEYRVAYSYDYYNDAPVEQTPRCDLDAANHQYIPYTTNPDGHAYQRGLSIWSLTASDPKNLGSGGRCGDDAGTPNGGAGSGAGGNGSAAGQSCPESANTGMVGDPINASNGNKFLQEDDYLDGGYIDFRRFYNSSPTVAAGSLGSNWRHTFDRSLAVVSSKDQSGVSSTFIVSLRPNGQRNSFTQQAGSWSASVDNPDVLVEVKDTQGVLQGYQLTVASTRNVELYNSSGVLQSITSADGQVTTLIHSDESTDPAISPLPNLLLSVQDSKGRHLDFSYDGSGRVAKVTLPDGQALTYSYSSSGDLVAVQYPGGSSRSYSYNESSFTSGASLPHAMTGIVDELGVRYEDTFYDTNGRATKTQFAGGVGATAISYGANSISTVTFPTGASTALGFSLINGASKITNSGQPCGTSCGQYWKSQQYDANGYPSSAVDFNGVSQSVVYDANGLVQQRVEAQGTSNQRTTQYVWDSAKRLLLGVTLLDSQGHVVSRKSFTRNPRGQIVAACEYDPSVTSVASYACGSSINAPNGVRQIAYTYCDAVDQVKCPILGLLLTIDGARTDVSDITGFQYYLADDESGCGVSSGPCHRKGDLYQTSDALAHVNTFVAYDKDGRVIRSKDANGVSSDFSYTQRGWLHSITTGGSTKTLDYDATGNITKVTDADGVYLSYGYDAAHRLTDVTDAYGNRIHYTLDNAGKKIKEDVLDSGSSIKKSAALAYNNLGQIVSASNGLGQIVFNADFSDSYDGNGNLVHSADGLGIQRKLGFDSLNRLTTTLENYNGTDASTKNTQSTLAYDALDRTEGVTDPDGLTTTYDYDGISNPVGLHSPDTGTTSFVADAAGNQVQKTDAKGIVVTASYDALNRAVSVSYPDSSQNIAYYYDEADGVTGCNGSYPIGRLTRIVETAVTTVYCYDSHGNVIRKTQVQGTRSDVVSYTYTAADRLNSITTPSGTSTQYTRDPNGRISSVVVTPAGAAGQTVVNAVSYLPFGPISGYTLGNGQAISRTYDANYQLTDLTSPALNLHYSRDVMGNITALGDSAGANPASESYGYDALYRLTAVNDPSGSAIEVYTYSRAGDRLSKTKTGGLATGVYSYQSATHWLTSIGTSARTYDLNGNTIGNSSAGETFGYAYNARNRLALVQRNQQTIAQYIYNASGERIAKQNSLTQAPGERFIYDEASKLLGEYQSSSRDYIWLEDLPIAVVDSANSSAINYVHADGLASPRVVSDASGNTIWQWQYRGNAFGEIQPGGSYLYNLRFPGQYYDSESGNIYNLNRYFDAATGRYIQSDPLGVAAGSSTYAYAGNDPRYYTDASGLFLSSIDATCVPNHQFCNEILGDILDSEGTIGAKLGDACAPLRAQAAKSLLDSLSNAAAFAPIPGALAEDFTRGIGGARGVASGFDHSLQDLFERANEPFNDTGLSKMARAWEKHAGRPGSILPILTGNVAAKNQKASNYLLEILTNPNTEGSGLSRGGFDFRLSPQEGVRFNANGDISGFLDENNGTGLF